MQRHLRAYEHGAEKHQLFLNHYERHFQHLTDRPIKLLELGIYKGGSLLQWRDFFPNGQIAGLDLDPVEVDDPSGTVRTYRGDQCDTALLDRIARECAPDGFDIVIDDASHIAALTKVSFWHLFDHHLKPGGYYVIEDWRVSYWEAWPDGGKYEWPNSPPVPRHHLASYTDHLAVLVKKLLDTIGINVITKTASRLYRDVKYKSRRFSSHDYGMVGLVKQLIDELGMDAITSPERNGTLPQQFPKFQRMEICPGQVFIVKATETDHALLAESLLHPFPNFERTAPENSQV